MSLSPCTIFCCLYILLSLHGYYFQQYHTKVKHALVAFLTSIDDSRKSKTPKEAWPWELQLNNLDNWLTPFLQPLLLSETVFSFLDKQAHLVLLGF